MIEGDSEPCSYAAGQDAPRMRHTASASWSDTEGNLRSRQDATEAKNEEGAEMLCSEKRVTGASLRPNRASQRVPAIPVERWGEGEG